MVTSTVRRIDRIVKRGGKVHTVKETETVAVAARKMSQFQVGCLIVVDNDGQIVGILSERDITSKVVAKTTDPLMVCASAIMTTKVISCSLSTPVDKARRIMSRHGTRHLPIVEDGVPVGMISSRDIMSHQLSATRAVARKQSRLLDDLERQNPGITQLRKDSRGRIVI